MYHVCPPLGPKVGKQNDPLLSFLTLVDELCAWEPSLTDEHFNLIPSTTDHFKPYIETSLYPPNKENQQLLKFRFIICAEHDAKRKNCTFILRLAQTFGLV